METMQIEALKLHPEFYCTNKGVCVKKGTCINPVELLMPVCPHLVVKSPGRELHDAISLHRDKGGSPAWAAEEDSLDVIEEKADEFNV